MCQSNAECGCGPKLKRDEAIVFEALKRGFTLHEKGLVPATFLGGFPTVPDGDRRSVVCSDDDQPPGRGTTGFWGELYEVGTQQPAMWMDSNPRVLPATFAFL